MPKTMLTLAHARKLERSAAELITLATQIRAAIGERRRAKSATVDPAPSPAVGPAPRKRGRPFDVDVARSKLGKAESVVFDCLREGLAARVIATRLGKSPSTIKNQTVRIFRRLEVSSREELRSRYPL